MAEYSEDGILDAMSSTGKSAEVFLVNIDAAKKALLQEKREYRSSVKRLLAVYKKHLNIKRKLEVKTSSRKSSRITRSEDDVKYAVTAVLESQNRAYDILKRAEEESNGLFDYYFGMGKSRLAKKENNKFDRYSMKEEKELEKIGYPVRTIIDNYSQNKKAQKEEERYQRESSQQPRAYDPYEDRGAQYFDSRYFEPRYHVPPPQPIYYDPYAYRQSVNISPVHLDVTPIVEECVKEVMDRFIKTIDQHLEKYQPIVTNSTAPTQTETDTSDKEAALSVVAEQESFVVDKLSELVENLKVIMQNIDSIGAANLEIINKNKEISELEKGVNDMQRTMLREMQGIQVKQKLLNQEQDALTEQQELAHARQAIVAENQSQLSASIEAVEKQIEQLLETHKKCEADIKDSIHNQKAIIQSGFKNTEMQTELSQKQIELAALIKQSAAAHKQAAKTQKSPTQRKSASEPKDDSAKTQTADSDSTEATVLEESREEKSTNQ